MDRWENLAIPLVGGLRLDLDKQTLGTQFPGSASVLQNYEPSINGGYARVKGYTKYSSTVVPGTGAILAVKPAFGGVFAIRKTGTDNALYYSTGTGWGSILNTTARTGTPTKARILTYDILAPSIVITDGVNPAGKYSGGTYTHLNGDGAPTAPKYSATFRDRLVLAPASTSSSFALSAATDDEKFNGVDGAAEISVGDTITGIYTFRKDLYIFCKNSIFRLTGSTTADFQIQDVSKKIGCLGHDTIQEIGGDLIFLSQTGLRSLAATDRVDDLELGTVSKGINPILKDYLGKDEINYSSISIPSKNQYRLFIYDSTLSVSSTINFLGKLTDTPIDPHGVYEWSTLVGLRASCADWNYDEEQEIAVFANGTADYVYRMESGSNFDGSSISYMCRTQSMTLGNADLRKVIQKLNVYTQVSGLTDITLNVLFDFQNIGVLQPPSINLYAVGGGAVWGAFSWDASTWAAVTFPIFKTNTVGSGFTVAFQFSGSDTNPEHRLDSLDVVYGQKARR